MASERRLTLILPPEPGSAAVVSAAVPRAAETFGLGGGAALKLTLAAEEVFLYLLDAAARERRLELDVTARPTAVEAAFGFEARDLDLGALNLTAQAEASTFVEQEDFARLGLLLAASAVDRMRLESRGARMRLALEVDRAYPEPVPPAPAPVEPQGTLRLERAPGADLLQAACLPVLAGAASTDRPAMIRAPGRLADLAAGGEAKAAVALDGRDRICGLICWTDLAARTVVFHGPYVTAAARTGEVARLLLDGFLEAVAKSGAAGVMTPAASPFLPAGEYESLGELTILAADGTARPRRAAFRLLGEDAGAMVWTHPALREFLTDAHSRLDLARDQRPVASLGESRPATSLFSASLEAATGTALLRPLMDGRDASANLARHAAALRTKGFPNILCEIDLAHGWHAALAGPLLENGFTPRLLHPLGGRSDLVIFQHEHPAAA